MGPLSALADTSMNGMATMKLNVTARFDPAPPKQGPETIVVTVKDTNGKAVKGAIVKVGSEMPMMSMTGPAVTAHDNGDGTYSARTKLNFATQWRFDIMASAGGRKGSTRLTADVK